MKNTQLTNYELRKQRLNKQNIFDKRNNITLVIDNLAYNENIGSLLRTCDCAGVKKVYTNKFNRDINKISTNISQWLDIEVTEDAYPKINNNDFVIVAEISSQSIDYREMNLDTNTNKNIILILGHEKYGVSQKWLDRADLTVHIPQYGINNSLNVATSGSIIMYKILEKLGK